MARPSDPARADARLTGRKAGGAVRVPGAILLALVASLVLAAACRAADEPVIDSALVLSQANGGMDFGGPQGIALDMPHGEVVVANTNYHRIEFFDLKTYPHGFFVHRVPALEGGLRDGMPSFVAVDHDGNIVVSDLSAPYVDIVDYRGRPVAHLQLPPAGDSAVAGHGPGALAVNADGTIAVATRGNEGRIYLFDADYHLKAQWGETGEERGRLQAISALAFTPEGHLLVACVRTKVVIQEFDLQGGFVRGFGIHDIGPGNFSFPSGIAVTADGRIWVSDALRHSVQVFDPAGKMLGAVGGYGVGPGEFVNPSALASDGKGLLALAENAGNRFQLMWVR